MKKRIFSALLSLAMVLSLCPVTAFAVDYKDTEDHWAESSIERFSDYGVLQGDDTGSFAPDASLTRGQMATIITRLMQLPEAESAGFSDVPADAWYADAVNRCAAAGIMLGYDGKATPNAEISREQSIVMLARTLGIEAEENPDLSAYSDAGSVADYAAGYVAAMNKAGIVQGVGTDTLGATGIIDRASAVTILDRSISAYANEPGQTVTGTGTGIVLIVADNVTVTGDVQDLIVAPGANDGSVTLQDAKVSGTVTVQADAAVNLTGETEAATLKVAEGAKAAVAVGEDAKVDTVSIAGAETSLEVNGTVGTVAVSEEASNASVTVGENATVESVEVAAEGAALEVNGTVGSVAVSEEASNASVTVGEKATVESVEVAAEGAAVEVSGTVGTVTVSETATGTAVTANSTATISTVNSAADNVTVSGSGKVTTANITGDNNAVNTSGTTVSVAADATGTTNNGSTVAAGTTTTTTAASSGVTTTTPSTSGGSTGDGSYNVSFVYNNGSDTTSVSVTSGSKVAAPAKQGKAGYTFDGWYKDEAFTSPFDFDKDTITAPTTLYAKWVPNTCTVTFDSNGGSAVASQTVNEGATVDQPENPTRDGYVFAYWRLVGEEGSYAFTAKPVTQDITLVAEWNKLCTVTFNSNEGTAVAGKTGVVAGSKITAPTAPTKTGNLFKGWFKDEEFKNAFSFDVDTVDDDITLYAKWEECTNHVSVAACTNDAETEAVCKNCGATYTSAEGSSFHEWGSDDVCLKCGESKADALKLQLSVASGAQVTATVYDDYSIVVDLPAKGNDSVNADSATITMRAQNVDTLEVGSEPYTITLNTGLGDKEAKLTTYLDSCYAFVDGTLNVTIGGKACSYTFTGNRTASDASSLNSTITGKPANISAARAAWKALTCKENITTATDENQNKQSITIANGSTLKIGTELLKFADGKGNLVLENLNDMSSFQTTVRDALELTTGAKVEGIAATLAAGTSVSLGSSSLTLNKDMDITITELDLSTPLYGDVTLANFLSKLQSEDDKNSNALLMQDIVHGFDAIVGALDKADSVNVTITFDD